MITKAEKEKYQPISNVSLVIPDCGKIKKNAVYWEEVQEGFLISLPAKITVGRVIININPNKLTTALFLNFFPFQFEEM